MTRIEDLRPFIGFSRGSFFRDDLRGRFRARNGELEFRAAGSLYWDILGIWSQIQAGLRKYTATCSQTPQGIAVDAWGVDFGLLDRRGRLIGYPFHYRDARTDGIPQHVFRTIPEREWFAETGVKTMMPESPPPPYENNRAIV